MKTTKLITVDADLVETIESKGLKFSQVVNRELRKALVFDKKDLPSDNLKISCSNCEATDLKEGSWCRETKKVFCPACELSYNHYKYCRPYFDGNGEHMHIKFPSNEGIKQEIIEIKKDGEEAEDRSETTY